MINTLNKMGLTHKLILINIIMMIGTFIAVVNQTLLTPVLPNIMEEMNVDASTAQWLTTGFMLINGIMVPITAYFLERFTTRKLFFSSMGLFVVGSFCSAISGTGFYLLLFGRGLQAASAGIMMPMMQMILLLSLKTEYRGVGMGVVDLVIGCAPAIAPVIAGFVTDMLDWHFLFYGMTLIALLVIITAHFYLEDLGETSKVKVDMRSVILSTIGFGGLLYGFSAAGSYGFNALVVVMIILAIVSLLVFTHRQLQLEVPLVNVRVLNNSKFMLSVVLSMLIQAALIVGTILMPIYIQTVRGYSAATSGLLLLPASIIMMIMNPISGRLFDKFGPRLLSVFGFLLATVFTLPMTMLNENTSLYFLAVVYALRIFGLSLVSIPLFIWGMNALDNQVMSHGVVIGDTFRQIAGAIGTAGFVTMMSIATAYSGNSEMNAAQIYGVNIAYLGATLMMVVALVISIIFVKEK